MNFTTSKVRNFLFSCSVIVLLFSFGSTANSMDVESPCGISQFMKLTKQMITSNVDSPEALKWEDRVRHFDSGTKTTPVKVGSDHILAMMIDKDLTGSQLNRVADRVHKKLELDIIHGDYESFRDGFYSVDKIKSNTSINQSIFIQISENEIKSGKLGVIGRHEIRHRKFAVTREKGRSTDFDHVTNSVDPNRAWNNHLRKSPYGMGMLDEEESNWAKDLRTEPMKLNNQVVLKKFKLSKTINKDEIIDVAQLETNINFLGKISAAKIEANEATLAKIASLKGKPLLADDFIIASSDRQKIKITVEYQFTRIIDITSAKAKELIKKLKHQPENTSLSVQLLEMAEAKSNASLNISKEIFEATKRVNERLEFLLNKKELTRSEYLELIDDLSRPSAISTKRSGLQSVH